MGPLFSNVLPSSFLDGKSSSTWGRWTTARADRFGAREPGSRPLATGSASAAGSRCVGGWWQLRWQRLVGACADAVGGTLFFATPPHTALTAVVVGAATSFGQPTRGVPVVALATARGGARGCGQDGGGDVCRGTSCGACRPDPVASGQGRRPRWWGTCPMATGG